MRKPKPYDRRLKASPIGEAARRTLRRLRSALMGERTEKQGAGSDNKGGKHDVL
jgi:hypothetical protein